MRHLIIAFLLIASYLPAQEMTGPPAQPGRTATAPVDEKDKCTIEGKVLDATTGKPLKKAVITLSPNERRDNKPMSVGTDAEGMFIFKSVDPGRFRLSASRRGYVTQQYGQTGLMRPGTVLTLQPGQHLKDILFRLQVGAAISGRVLDDDGEPMANVQVNALRQSYREGKRALLPAGFASTNDLGEYRIFGLAPGEYFVRATFNGNFMAGAFVAAESEQVGDNTYAPVFYPGVQEPSQATPMNLRSGDENRADFNLTLTHAVSVRGKVINTGGASGRVWLMLVPHEEMQQFTFGPGNTAAVNADDSFEFKHVLPGSYTIMGRTNEEKSRYTARQNIDVADRNLTNVIVAFRAGGEVPGRFTLTGSFPTRLKNLNIFLQPDSGIFLGGAGASAKDDGSFVLTGVGDDVYRVHVNGLPPNTYVKTVRYGSEDVIEKGFSPSGGPDSLEIVLSNEGGTISGAATNKDQNGQPGITVVAVPDHPIKWIAESSKPTNTDQNGRFTIQGLRPGRYRLYAFEAVEPGAFDDPQFMKKYIDQGKNVDVSENSQQTVDLKIVPKEENQ